MTGPLPVAAAALALATLALPAVAQDPNRGAAIFADHCAGCHGPDATGGGPLAPALILQPPDLTRMSERNLGTFPMIRVVMRIDGREPLVSHGSPMPIFGPFFDGPETALKAETGQPMLVQEEVADLVAWLQSVQE